MADAAGALSDERIVRAAFARVHPGAFGVACGAVAAGLIAIATVYLLAKGASGPGQPIGPHLALLAHFLPYYSVSWLGACIGAAGGFVVGFVFGASVAAIWNLGHHAWLMAYARRADEGPP